MRTSLAHWLECLTSKQSMPVIQFELHQKGVYLNKKRYRNCSVLNCSRNVV